VRRVVIAVVELVVFSVLIVATRCANHGEVFVNGEIFFTDADCYARMSRVRMCLEQPGLIVRHHSFENFPAGTTPHTTAPLDYLIAGLAAALKPFSARAVDLAGAFISPLLGIVAGWFLWWWSRQRRLRYRFALLLLYAASPILVHATELGRPDHQSLLLALVAIALCAECTLMTAPSRTLGIVSGAAWGLSLWVSLYEPLVLLAVVVVSQVLAARQSLVARHRLAGWLVFAGILVVALAVERRLPGWPHNNLVFHNWSHTIGELSPVALTDPIWLRWAGLLLVPAPALLWIAVAKRRVLPVFLAAIVCAGFVLTMWQARWAYFFVLSFAIAVPFLLEVIPNRIAGGILVAASLFPILKDWDERLWPGEERSAAIAGERADAAGFRAIASQIDGPFLAPWWWSPALAYWSGQPGVSGSSHEALEGIERTARFYLAASPEEAHEILVKTGAAWVVAYDVERTVTNSAALLGVTAPENALGRVLDRAPSQAPPDLELRTQNSSGKLYRVRFFLEK